MNCKPELSPQILTSHSFSTKTLKLISTNFEKSGLNPII